MGKKKKKSWTLDENFKKSNKKLLREAVEEQRQISEKKLLKKKPKRTDKKVKITYKKYIRSFRWEKRRIQYYSKHPKSCVACGGNQKIGLHHISYKNLGYEKDEDLIPLCWGCHEDYHKLNGTERINKNTHSFVIEKQEEEELYVLSKNL